MIYLDNASTTKLRPEVLEAMQPYLTECYGNADSIHSFGKKSAEAVERARKIIADAIGAEPEEILFTSGAAEANSWVVQYASDMIHSFGFRPRIAYSAIEHSSIMNAMKQEMPDVLMKRILPADKYGYIHIDKAEVDHFDFVSLMLVNNEIGTVQKVNDIKSAFHPVLIHTDATQALGHIAVNVRQLGVDFLSSSAHKLGGPKGVGFLYVRKPFLATMKPLIYGGQQESGLRGGTTNVAGIVGFGKAVELAMDFGCGRLMEQATGQQILFRTLITKELPNVQFNSPLASSIWSVTIPEVRGEEMVAYLDQFGICISTGSACETGNENPSHVLLAIGKTPKEANSTIRISVGWDTTEDEVKEAAERIIQGVKMLR